MKKIPAMKNLYLPGTNKNVGFMLGNTMHIYDKYIKYFPVETSNHDYNGYGLNVGKKFMVEKDDKIIKLINQKGWYHEVSEKMYTFFDCEFEIPDNLDVVEILYLYKNWNRKNTNGK